MQWKPKLLAIKQGTWRLAPQETRAKKKKKNQRLNKKLATVLVWQLSQNAMGGEQRGIVEGAQVGRGRAGGWEPNLCVSREHIMRAAGVLQTHFLRGLPALHTLRLPALPQSPALLRGTRGFNDRLQNPARTKDTWLSGGQDWVHTNKSGRSTPNTPLQAPNAEPFEPL